jgi:hypothetical protein
MYSSHIVYHYRIRQQPTFATPYQLPFQQRSNPYPKRYICIVQPLSTPLPGSQRSAGPSTISTILVSISISHHQSSIRHGASLYYSNLIASTCIMHYCSCHQQPPTVVAISSWLGFSARGEAVSISASHVPLTLVKDLIADHAEYSRHGGRRYRRLHGLLPHRSSRSLVRYR